MSCLQLQQLAGVKELLSPVLDTVETAHTSWAQQEDHTHYNVNVHIGQQIVGEGELLGYRYYTYDIHMIVY